MSGQKESAPWTNHLALWAGLTALFSNLAAINVVALLGDESDARVTAIAAVVTSVMVAAAVFAKQKWDDERTKRKDLGHGDSPPSEQALRH